MSEAEVVIDEIDEHARAMDPIRALHQAPTDGTQAVAKHPAEVRRPQVNPAMVLQVIVATRIEVVGRRPLLEVLHSCRSRTDVRNRALRDVERRPAGQSCAATQVDLLEVEEESLVEQVDLFEHAAPDHHARAGQPVDLLHLRGDR